MLYNLFATFQTWLITNITGMFLMGLLFYCLNPEGTGLGALLFYVLIFSLLWSIPGMVIYHIAGAILYRLMDEPVVVKIILSFLAVVIVSITIILFLRNLNPKNLDDMSKVFPYIGCYSAPFIACIFLFRRRA